MDKGHPVLWGSYNSSRAQLLSIKFRMCEGEDYCESVDNIRKWLRRKWIVLLYNEKRFDS